jgi:hypothetical protein
MPSHVNRSKKQCKPVDVTAELEAIHPKAPGIGVGSAEHYVAVPVGRDPQPVPTFGSFTSDRHRLAHWLKRCRIETVVMPATGVYWIAL